MSDPAAGPATPGPSTTSASAADDATLAQAARAVRGASGSAARYRVMAYVTGVMLLLLCLEIVLRYVFSVDNPVLNAIPIVHGWIYVVYLVTVVDLWSKMRWSFGRLATMVLGGVVPTLSFFVEKRVHAEAHAKIAEAAAAIQARTAA